MIYKRIKELCKETGISVNKLESTLSISKGSLCKIDINKPSSEKLQKIAEYFGVESDWLSGKSDFKTKKDIFQHFDDIADIPALRSDVFRLERGMKIPVLGDVAAGTPIFAEENHIGSEEISQELASTGEFFALRIHGDSMSPRISEGDIVIVRQQDDAETGDIVIVLINGDSATCKRLLKYQEGITLISFNPTYEPMKYSNKDILEKPVKIMGKVIENRQKY